LPDFLIPSHLASCLLPVLACCRCWHHQDCLKTKPKCEAAARDALARGFSPVIDRTNVDAKQREPWLKIAAQAGVPAWSVFLRVGPKLCMQRVAARIEHETNPKPFVVNMLKGRLRAPHTDEGFGQTLVAATPAEVSSLIERLGSSDGSRADEDDSAAPSLERPAKRVRATAGVAARTPAQSRLSIYRGDLFGNEILLRGAGQGGRAAVTALTALCHCVSRDLAMGKGIAAEFKRRYSVSETWCMACWLAARWLWLLVATDIIYCGSLRE
jgi:hypothetical protein